MRILIAGGEGQVGREFAEITEAGLTLLRCGRNDMDITDAQSIQRAMMHFRPDAIINAAAYTAVDKAESERELAFAINAGGTANLARAAQTAGIPLLHISTDYVFSGDKPVGQAYTEEDVCHPKTVYGQSKWEGDLRALDICSNTVVMRTSWVFGRFGGNFPKTMLRLGAEREQLGIVSDQWGCPTYATDIAITAIAALRAMSDKHLTPGPYHYAGDSACTWFDLASYTLQNAVAANQLPKLPLLTPITTADYPVPAPRPANSVLDCSRLISCVPTITLSDWRKGITTLLASSKS